MTSTKLRILFSFTRFTGVTLYFFAICLSFSCCQHKGMLRDSDYIKMTDEEIKTVFLKSIPLGTKQSTVKRILKEKFNCSLRKESTYDRQSIVEDVNRKSPIKIELGDYYMETGLASYGWAKHFFLAGHYVSASWLFSKDGVLKDISVCHCWDGV